METGCLGEGERRLEGLRGMRLQAVDRLASSLLRANAGRRSIVVDLHDPVSCEVIALSLERVGCGVRRLEGCRIRVLPQRRNGL